MMAAAAVIAFLMAAVETVAMVMTALVLPAMVMSAFMSFTVMVTAFMSFSMMVTVVITLCVGIKLQRALSKRFGCCISRTGYTAVKHDTRLGQRVPCSHADAAADQGIRLRGIKEAG